MKRLLAVLPILCLLLASCSSTMSFFGLGGKEEKSQEPTIVLVDYGTYDANGALTLSTTSIPRKLGTTFGLRFRTLKPEGGTSKVKIVTASPGLIDPSKNAVVFSTETVADVATGKEYNCTFTFEKEWEMASGDWTLTATAEDGSSVKKTFQVFNPQQ
ncbi:hypothetical protein DFW101_2587 [Solidesulfovibrio carbinoliphilus subsp. oakridgensis]|uniref:Barwin domain-containing protein n=1 Tax=Solidesulfovibrio carbinoliphilus subsp. oakridgensis TaxID=694327 RepID=G7Q8H9_9BACT|nr:DUF3859 domain-containing protein [Solidesulfovibrio carbinoliphilus]EHJ48591.1 hypothetical protein DFW101_2587 [Solidesulfovibrio carbinoliphilus subsp. oakridgensis]